MSSAIFDDAKGEVTWFGVATTTVYAGIDTLHKQPIFIGYIRITEYIEITPRLNGLCVCYNYITRNVICNK